MNLSVAVQHHPSRAHLLAGLRELGEHEVVTDPDPEGERSALRTYLAALASTPAQATHRLIVQDDAMPCSGFRRRAEEVIARVPDALVCFFVPGVLALRAAIARSGGDLPGLAALRGAIPFVPTVALSWPSWAIPEYVAFAEQGFMQNPVAEMRQGDDYPPMAWLKARRRSGRPVELLATVPSLVEHPDVVPSLMPLKVAKAGRNRARVAISFEG